MHYCLIYIAANVNSCSAITREYTHSHLQYILLISHGLNVFTAYHHYGEDNKKGRYFACPVFSDNNVGLCIYLAYYLHQKIRYGTTLQVQHQFAQIILRIVGNHCFTGLAAKVLDKM